MKPTPNDAVVMHWRPKLMKLTQVANPDMGGGDPTPLYVDPQMILSVRRTMSSFATKESYGRKQGDWEYHPTVECTEIHCGHLTLLVTESPEDIAKLRDQAFGVADEPPPPNVVGMAGRKA